MGECRYFQCRLRQGRVFYTAWLPEDFAFVGRLVGFKTDVGWDEGWVVEEVYRGSMRSHQQIVERSQDYKTTRRASG